MRDVVGKEKVEQTQVVILFDEVRDGLNTAEMSLEDMISEMRELRESSDYEVKSEDVLR